MGVSGRPSPAWAADAASVRTSVRSRARGGGAWVNECAETLGRGQDECLRLELGIEPAALDDDLDAVLEAAPGLGEADDTRMRPGALHPQVLERHPPPPASGHRPRLEPHHVPSFSLLRSPQAHPHPFGQRSAGSRILDLQHVGARLTVPGHGHRPGLRRKRDVAQQDGGDLRRPQRHRDQQGQVLGAGPRPAGRRAHSDRAGRSSCPSVTRVATGPCSATSTSKRSRPGRSTSISTVARARSPFR